MVGKKSSAAQKKAEAALVSSPSALPVGKEHLGTWRILLQSWHYDPNASVTARDLEVELRRSAEGTAAVQDLERDADGKDTSFPFVFTNRRWLLVAGVEQLGWWGETDASVVCPRVNTAMGGRQKLEYVLRLAPNRAVETESLPFLATPTNVIYLEAALRKWNRNVPGFDKAGAKKTLKAANRRWKMFDRLVGDAGTLSGRLTKPRPALFLLEPTLQSYIAVDLLTEAKFGRDVRSEKRFIERLRDFYRTSHEYGVECERATARQGTHGMDIDGLDKDKRDDEDDEDDEDEVDPPQLVICQSVFRVSFLSAAALGSLLQQIISETGCALVKNKDGGISNEQGFFAVGVAFDERGSAGKLNTTPTDQLALLSFAELRAVAKAAKREKTSMPSKKGLQDAGIAPDQLDFVHNYVVAMGEPTTDSVANGFVSVGRGGRLPGWEVAGA
ncbi:hypothetical protein Rhopal_003644-T1 [Rhodotorula paludigena]|uniref:Uncharacterized protein n=1 Tax=Rhodotorula paludigena TaxID=86838 RepID=A0AAV5GMC8_9BASI|nr:hypothetical protein Rhopal_003644-T1 [Rhodotorula paludigena]